MYGLAIGNTWKRKRASGAILAETRNYSKAGLVRYAPFAERPRDAVKKGQKNPA